jgi:TonB family protein
MSNPESWKSWEGGVVGGKFPLRQWLGGSDHSAVFLTDRHGHSDQKAAIKLIAEIPAESERQRARWRAAAQLSHPDLIRIDEIGRCQMNGTSLLYVVMEYAEEDLSQILPQRALAAAEVTEMLPPLLDALSYLHGKGFVHTRIKPSNVLAVGDLLKLSTDQATAPVESGSEGTRRDVYDAPETASGIVSAAGDMWSVGAMLVEALTQKPPFAPETAPRDRGVPASVPEPFRGIARECLHDDPKRRCSIADIKARMQPAARSVPDPTPVTAAPTPARNDWSMGRVLLPIAILLIFGLGVRALYKAFSRKPPTGGQYKLVAPSSAPDTTAATPMTPSAKPAASARSAVPAAPVRQPAAPPKKAAASQGEVLLRVMPDVARSAQNTITGTIKVDARVDVDATGKVTAVKLARPGPSKYFAGLAEKAAEKWQFSPLGADGKASESTWMLRFRFKRTSTQVDAARVSR